MRRRKRLSVSEYVEGILNQNRVVYSQAITLVESHLEQDQEIAQEILEKILPHTGKAIRLGITGVPGVGKSTFIESFGKYITSKNKKLAVLAIDPSSQKTKGSIMGDKTRMEELSIDSLAYIRPSASGNSLGGVARKTRETMLICEAAGYEVIFIETVGVGQSETQVKNMVDFFLLLMLAGAGDELQGIKKGIMEMADLIAINKADGENLQKAKIAQNEYTNALHLFPPSENNWYAKVLTCSALQNIGIAEVWREVLNYQKQMQNNGFWQGNRQTQNLIWMHESIKQALEESFYQAENVKGQISTIEKLVNESKIPAFKAAQKLLNIYKQKNN